MGKNTGIAWTDHTFNPWRGCMKVSPACKNCYAMELVDRFGGDFLGQRVVAAESYWKEPLKWNKSAIAVCNQCGHECLCEEMPKTVDPMKVPYDFGECSNCGGKQHKLRRQRVFCASLADVFEDWDGPIVDNKNHVLKTNGEEWYFNTLRIGRDVATMSDVRRRLFQLIDATPNLDWLVLTKRPENIEKMLPPAKNMADPQVPWFRKNLWLGTTVENQEQADKRIPELLKCRDLSPVLFLSCEPLLGPVDLSEIGGDANRHPYTAILESQQINWVIVGGESGKNFRPMPTDWVQSLHRQCEYANTPFFCKQGAGPKSGLQYDLPSALFNVKQFPESHG